MFELEAVPQRLEANLREVQVQESGTAAAANTLHNNFN